jgi:hypothetical protein
MGLAGAAERAGFNYLVGILLVVCIVPPLTFVAHRCWTYRVTALGSAGKDPASQHAKGAD